MNAELAVYHILCNDPVFRAHVGTNPDNAKVFYDIVPQKTQLPYTVLRESNVEPNDTKNGVSDLDFGSVEVEHFAKGRKEVAQMATDARKALDRAAAGEYNTVSVESIQFQDQKSDAYEQEDGIQHIKEQRYQVMVRI